MKYLLSAILVFSVSIPSTARGQAAAGDTLFLNVVLPDQDTIRGAPARYRVAARTHPQAQAFINNEPVRVYESGAFVGMVNVGPGENVVDLRVVGQDGQAQSRRFVLIPPEPLTASPRDRLVIEDVMMRPAEDRWLLPGEVLETRFKGTPGREAFFSLRGIPNIWFPMEELPADETGGVEGIYVGRYVVQPGDQVERERVRFRLGRYFWRQRRAESPGRITVAPYDTPRVVELTGRRPFLNASLGTDRLGAAKLGYLEPGVKAVVNGRVGDQWRVRLGDDLVGWLPVDFAELRPKDTPVPSVLVGSVSAVGNPREDIVTVSLGDRIPYTHRMRTDAPEIIVDLYGASGNTNWITHHLSAEGIDRVWWEQAGRHHYRLHIGLTRPAHWGYDVGYGDTPGLQIRIRRAPEVDEDGPLAGLRIAVDAGHGGTNRGAIGATGAEEKNITLGIALRLEQLLAEHGASVILTRERDEAVSMADRLDLVLTADADLLVSIHANSVGLATDPERVRGTSTYYRHPAFKPLSDAIYARLLELDLEEFGVVGSFNFSLNAPTQLPNVLVETAFISHPEEEMLLLDPDFQHQLAEKVVDGLIDFVLAHGDVTPRAEEAGRRVFDP